MDRRTEPPTAAVEGFGVAQDGRWSRDQRVTNSGQEHPEKARSRLQAGDQH